MSHSMSTAFVFPGQGSHSVGMLGALAAADPVVQATFGEASAVLGYDLWERVSDGPAEALNPTEIQQPAILVADIAAWRAWNNVGGPRPDVVLGHSLGEFAALVAAGAIGFAPAVALVQLRGQLMQSAVPQGTGGMAAILGLEDAQVREICSEAAQGEVVEAVNFNGPGQVVIAGDSAALGRAMALCKERGAKRALPLPISVPCHSSLLRDAAARLGEALRREAFSDPAIRFVSPFDVAVHATGSELPAMLEAQLSSPVRWTETVQYVAKSGATRFVECGPGEVLTGMNKRILRRHEEIQCLAFNDPASLERARASFQEAA